MASITTILGTHSLSSSRLTINNNFDNINEELGTIENVLDTTQETLTLSSFVRAGQLFVNNGTLATFTVDGSVLTSGVESTFKENVIFEKGQQVSIMDTVNFPTGIPVKGAYLYNDAQTPILLGPSNPGQTLTVIGTAEFSIDASNGNLNGYDANSTIDIAMNGSISFMGDMSGKWYIVGSNGATIS